MAINLDPGTGKKKMVFYEDREEAYYRPPTPKIEAVPTPQFVEPDITWGNIPKPKPPGYTMTRDEAIRRGLYTPTLPAGKYYEPVENIPRRWINPTPGTYSGGPPTASYATDPYNTWLNISAESAMREMYYRGPEWFRRGANLARNILGATGLISEEPKKSGLSVDWAGLWRNYVNIYKKLYQGPIFDFVIQGPQEPLYEPEQYVPQYEYAETPTYTIRYGGGGTPSSSRNYASNLINWRV
jgi:hypothetical protein